jgi:hypothetical protein
MEGETRGPGGYQSADIVVSEAMMREARAVAGKSSARRARSVVAVAERTSHQLADGVRVCS